MSKNFTLFTAFVLLVLMAVTSSAQHDAHSHKHDHKDIEIKPVDTSNVEVRDGEAVIIVQGIVCSFCSQGVKRKLSKLSFIDKSRYSKGVKVEIEIQRVTIAIKPGTEIDMEEVFKSIKSGGYEPVVAYNKVEGDLVTVYPGG